MNRFKTALLFGSLLPLLALGCVHVRHQGTEEALYPCEPSPYLPAARNEVYLFILNNADVTEMSGLLKLRDQLALLGFPKVYYAQQADLAWYTREIRRIHRDRPDARLLLMSYGNSASKLLQLAQEAVPDELPIDAVIFLDPFGLNGDLRNCLPYTTYQIRSHNWLGSRQLVTHQNYELSGVGHLSAAHSQQTLRIMMNLLNSSTERVPGARPEDLPAIPMKLPKPTPRPEIVISDSQMPEWNFLKRQIVFPTLPTVPDSRDLEKCPNGNCGRGFSGF
jgi:hypothetical protein